MNIYPSVMAVDQADLQKEITLLQPHCAGFHIDVMDNIFVPNMTWNAQEVNAMVTMMTSPWIHLMVENPVTFYEQLSLPAQSLVSFHIEAKIDIFDFIKTIKEKKHNPSIAIRPKTSMSDLVPFLNVVDHILVMSVEPGFSGQHFLPNTFNRLDELAGLCKRHNAHVRVGIDGGVTKKNIHELAAQDVDDCAIATAIFQHADHLRALQELQKLARV